MKDTEQEMEIVKFFVEALSQDCDVNDAVQRACSLSYAAIKKLMLGEVCSSYSEEASERVADLFVCCKILCHILGGKYKEEVPEWSSQLAFAAKEWYETTGKTLVERIFDTLMEDKPISVPTLRILMIITKQINACMLMDMRRAKQMEAN